jgi:hypothetical protein
VPSGALPEVAVQGLVPGTVAALGIADGKRDGGKEGGGSSSERQHEHLPNPGGRGPIIRRHASDVDLSRIPSIRRLPPRAPASRYDLGRSSRSSPGSLYCHLTARLRSVFEAGRSDLKGANFVKLSARNILKARSSR